MSHIVEAAEGHGLDAGTLRAAGDVVARAVHAGHGDEDFSRLVRVYA